MDKKYNCLGGHTPLSGGDEYHGDTPTWDNWRKCADKKHNCLGGHMPLGRGDEPDRIPLGFKHSTLGDPQNPPSHAEDLMISHVREPSACPLFGIPLSKSFPKTHRRKSTKIRK